MQDRYKFQPRPIDANEWMPKVLLILAICVGGIYFVLRFASQIDSTKLNLEVLGWLILFIVFSLIFYKPLKRLKRHFVLWLRWTKTH